MKKDVQLKTIIIILFAVILFFLGLYVYATGQLNSLKIYENMEDYKPPQTQEQITAGQQQQQKAESFPITTTYSPSSSTVSDTYSTFSTQNRNQVTELPIALRSQPESSVLDCPDLLVKKNAKYYLYDRKKPIIEGQNPIEFNTLEDYKSYFDQQKLKGSTCPLLYVQQETNAQGKEVYRTRASPFEPQGGTPVVPVSSQHIPINGRKDLVPYVDSSRDHKPFNTGMYPGFDPSSQYVGKYTEIDAVHDSTQKFPGGSPNPADPNWIGVAGTDNLVATGFYAENEIWIPAN